MTELRIWKVLHYFRLFSVYWYLCDSCELDRKQLIHNELEDLREREATTAIQNQRLTDSIVELEKVCLNQFGSHLSKLMFIWL